VFFWRRLVGPIVRRGKPTPFYLFSVEPIRTALAELDARLGQMPVHHWLSCKTQPLRPLLQWWHQQGRPIEVVSEFEFLAALAEGFDPENILVNGPAKHRWLPRHARRGLSVNFDSPSEARALAPLARKLNWRCGVRLQTREEFDPETPELPTQFGMTGKEAVGTLRALKRVGVRMEIVHFHLRTNVGSASIYDRALAEAAEICQAASFAPKFLDCGGGFPPPHVMTCDGRPVDAQFQLLEIASVLKRALVRFPSAKEVWLENGRWLTARSGALVVKVLDVKDRSRMRSLICDGGRTMNALISNWEAHEIITLPERRGAKCLTTANGPTCMAFDQLARRALPRSLRAGDHLVWLDAGAYHLPWETRFSHGVAAVFWHDGWTIRRVREAETFRDWWSQWT
jgi:diaminopimelate decarboxylase